jgi:hypothetical protein
MVPVRYLHVAFSEPDVCPFFVSFNKKLKLKLNLTCPGALVSEVLKAIFLNKYVNKK